jgi:predicted DNA-binding transcriptional regulator YafY
LSLSLDMITRDGWSNAVRSARERRRAATAGMAGKQAADWLVPTMRHPATQPLARRIQAIDQALRAGRWPTGEALALALEVDARTIRRDTRFMRLEQHAPIGFDRRRKGYYYTEPTFRLPSVQMTQGELLALYLSERMLRQFRGTPFERDLRRAIDKLGESLPAGVTVRLDTIAEFLSVLASTQAEYDPDSICTLLRAIIGRRHLRMVYWTASRNETSGRDFDPSPPR